MDLLHEEIGEVEARIADSRAALAEACEVWLRHARDQAVAPRSLALIAAAGFVLGTAMRAKPAAPRKTERRGGGIAGLLVSLAMALVKARYGHPMNALARLLAPSSQPQSAQVAAAASNPAAAGQSKPG